MPAIQPSQNARDFLALRRSANKAGIGAPGPSGDELDELLAAATRVPDHRRLEPWRFIVFEGEARETFGEAAAKVHEDEAPQAGFKALEETKGLLMRAPTVVAVVSSPKDDNKTPIWEQELSAGALCYNLLLTTNASGWAGCWLTEWISFSSGINKLLGLKKGERIAGFIYLGTATMDPQERARPGEIPIERWTG